MTAFTLVTGNQHKFAQLQRLLDDVEFDYADIDLPEIQSLDSEEIVEAKLKEAYRQLQRPVVVEDVSCGIDSWNGLPGPFIKFFEKQLGKDAIYQIGGETRITVSCVIGYYDGKKTVFGTGIVHGQSVPARGDSGFGFDYCFVPDGQTKTRAEMTDEEKMAVSHRRLAVEDLRSKLGF